MIAFDVASSSTTMEPDLAFDDSACLRPSAFTFFGRSNSWLCTTGPMALAPPTNSGAERGPVTGDAAALLVADAVLGAVDLKAGQDLVICRRGAWRAARRRRAGSGRARGSRPKIASLSSTSLVDLLSRLRTFVFMVQPSAFPGSAGSRGRSRRVALLHGNRAWEGSLCGRLTASRTMTQPPFDPGTAPLIMMRPRSTSTLATSRFSSRDVVDAVMAVHLLVLEGTARILAAAVGA